MIFITVLQHFLVSVIILPWCDSFIDIRRRFELPHLPIDLKQQILTECNPTFIKFFQIRRRMIRPSIRTAISDRNNEITNVTAVTITSEVKETTITQQNDDDNDDDVDKQQCPAEVNNCIFGKTAPFMEHCNVKCLLINGKLTYDLNCWNDNCFIRATRICEEKFWRTVRLENRKKKKKKMRCISEIKHCYKLACLKCLGRECNIACYGGGIQYTSLTKPRWKGYEEYRKFFPEIEDISNQYVLVPQKIVLIEDYNE